MRIMPLYIPNHKFWVLVSGIAEIFLGIAILFNPIRNSSLWLIIGMFICFLPVHIHMISDKKAGLNFPKSVLIIRLLVQFVLIYWVYLYIE